MAQKVQTVGGKNPFCSRGCYEKNTKSKNKKTTDGYILTQSPGHPRSDKYGYVLEHIIVMEEKIKRFVSTEEVIHHIDGTRNNNSPENLMLFSCDGEHIKYHGQQRRANR